MNSKDLKDLFNAGFQQNTYLRLSHEHELKVYVGSDDNGRYTIKLVGKFHPERIASSLVITVQQLVQGDDYSLIFSLDQADMLEYFCAFCCDLITSIENIDETDTAYKEMVARYFSWKKMFRTTPSKLADKEIMGLLAELLFLRDRLFPAVGPATAIDAWSGPEKTHKDFSLDDTWCEIKAISSSNTSVKISSLEQLDSNVDGTLCVYRFEQMSPAFDGLKLNGIVMSILHSLPHSQVYELFMSKLEQAGYTWNADYDNLVFDLTETISYDVKDDFPRLKREDIPMAISRVQYDILLTEIEPYKSQIQ